MNIYVSNINFRASDDDLMQLFSQYGEVQSARIITDKFTGRSRGFGFVEINDNDQANEAINSLNGYEYMEKALSVTEARPRTEGDRPRSNNGGGGGNRFDKPKSFSNNRRY